MPGLRFKLWPMFGVKKFPWVQVPAGEIGVVIAQVGEPLPIGAKSAVYKPEFGNFSSLREFVDDGGQKGVQRPVLPPGTLVPIHPVAFLVLTTQSVYGLPVSPELASRSRSGGMLVAGVVRPHARPAARRRDRARRCRSTSSASSPRSKASRCRRATSPAGSAAFDDIAAMEHAKSRRCTADAELIEVLLGSKNDLHNNYQDFQKFLDAGGKIGLQHDPLLYGAYLLNPFLVRVDLVPMLVVNQGEVAVDQGASSACRRSTRRAPSSSSARSCARATAASGRSRCAPASTRSTRACTTPRSCPTSILTLNWADATSEAHDLDAQLSSIVGKSREGFVFQIDLQVQIHVPDTRAPKVISMVGTMRNLVNEVLQSAVGNHFRNTLQALEAVQFIETRQRGAGRGVRGDHRATSASTRWRPRASTSRTSCSRPSSCVVLTQREIANQEKATFEEQQRAADVARRDGEGQGHRRHAGAARQRAGRRADQGQRGRGARGRRRG